MPESLFTEKIKEKIADESLQAALDANAMRRVQARINAFESLPDWRERRKKAHNIRAQVIDQLDELLAQFIQKVRANGIQVHRASDSAEAVGLVFQIAREAHPQREGTPLLFAKSKSMLSEEIGLNHALEKAGHRVVETDLGEYIIQLRGERPGHIITPAVHLRRHQVGELFHQKLGIPYTEDIPTLTRTARAVLREVFFSADVGISGVNFGVAETGTLTLVTNEGNGRMCTTMPPVHIALMGMERLVPTLDDLALFLSLLPRSATGQILSVYTQLIHAPEYGQQKHLIIVDNGRSRVRNSALRESLYCIRCGACLNACPVFRELGGHGYIGADGSIAPYPGPIGSVISPAFFGENYLQLAGASSLCGACKDACPVDIDLPALLLRTRAGMAAPVVAKSADKVTPAPSSPWLKLGLSLYGRMASHPRLFSLAQKLAGWFSQSLPGYFSVPAFTGWGLSRDMPKPAARSFRDTYMSANPVYTGIENISIKLPSEAAPTPIPAPVSAPRVEASLQEMDQLFRSRLEAVGGVLHPVRPEGLSQALLDWLQTRGFIHVQMVEHIPEVNLQALGASGVQIHAEYINEVQVGITAVLAGIAETGSLVVCGGQGRSLRASLLPEIHVAVLYASQLVASPEKAFRLPAVAGSPAAVLVTGPSRTADIEMTLTIGVHGPAELHVFLVDDVLSQ